jgi:hypothetical protein
VLLQGSSRSVDYIQLWSGDETVLLQSLELIRDVASRILTALERAVDTTTSERDVEPSVPPLSVA